MGKQNPYLISKKGFPASAVIPCDNIWVNSDQYPQCLYQGALAQGGFRVQMGTRCEDYNIIHPCTHNQDQPNKYVTISFIYRLLEDWHHSFVLQEASSWILVHENLM